MKLLQIEPDVLNRCAEYCEQLTENPPIPRPDHPVTDPINTGRFIIGTEYTPLAESIQTLCDSIREQIPHLVPIPNPHPYPHSFSTLWHTDRITSAVHRHIDPAGPLGQRHLRILFMLQRASHGGEPCVYNKIIQAQPGECWAIWADKQIHWSTPVTKPGVRSILTMGYWCEPDQAQSVLSALKPRVHHTTPGL